MEPAMTPTGISGNGEEERDDDSKLSHRWLLCAFLSGETNSSAVPADELVEGVAGP